MGPVFYTRVVNSYILILLKVYISDSFYMTTPQYATYIFDADNPIFLVTQMCY